MSGQVRAREAACEAACEAAREAHCFLDVTIGPVHEHSVCVIAKKWSPCDSVF